MTTPRPARDDASFADSSRPAQEHAEAALEQGARFAAALAIARWSGHANPGMPPQAGWFAQTQDGFAQWLGAGGFAQHAADSAAACEDRLAPLPFPGSRPRFYTLFRKCSSTAD